MYCQYCGKCGEEIKEGEIFCGECGKRIIREAPESADKNSEIKKSLFKKIQLSIEYRIIFGIILAAAIIFTVLSVLEGS